MTNVDGLVCRAVVAATVLSAAGVCVAAAPRVAVWDPKVGTHESRFKIDSAFHDQASAWLSEGGCAVTRLTAAQMGDPAVLRAESFDACVSAGDAVPRQAMPALLSFAEQGGVLVALDARIPFTVAIEPDKDGWWTMSPKEPKFAWQTDVVLGAVGGRYVYSPGMHDLGMNHTVTPLLKRYLPEAPDILKTKLTSNFIFPSGGGVYYPLLRSRRYDGKDTTPQLWVMRNGKRTAIVSVSSRYTGASDTNLWAHSRATVVALARLAKDLHDGALALTPDMAIDFSEKIGPPAPLTARSVRGSGVEPEGAKPVARWGRFDGSGLEFGAALAAGQRVDVPANADCARVPGALEAGAALRLTVPAAKGDPLPRFLRVRGAYREPGVTLRVSVGDTVFWNETLSAPDAGGAGNTQSADLKDLPVEFVRIVYLPPSEKAAVALSVANAGTATLYFDALQVETPGAPRAMRIGFNSGYLIEAKGKDPVSRELTRSWGGLRANIRTQFVGKPEDPKRWERSEALLKSALEVNPHVELIWEGTAEWCAVSPERYADGVRAKRPHVVVPDLQKYAEIVEHFVSRYGDKIEMFELWNEANSTQFWRGTYQEYADFCKVMIPIIRKFAPRAKIISTGTAGWNDSFFDVLVANDLMKDIDLVPNHVYAGKSAGWDIAYGVGQGGMYAAGVEKEIYCNEQGFVWQNCEWFTAPPAYTPHLQMALLNTALARLMASDLAKVSIFHAGGDRHPFGLIDAQGVPRPAYAVIADYLPLNNGRRWNVALTAADGSSLSGVYEAASLHPDGSVTVVLNPAEVDRLQAPREVVNPSCAFLKDTGAWSGFQGKAGYSNGVVRLVPAKGQAYMGFGQAVTLDLDRWPVVEVEIPECSKAWSFSVRASGQDAAIFRDLPSGTHRADLREFLESEDAVTDATVTFRVDGPTALAAVRYLPPAAAAGVTVRPAAANNLLETAQGVTFFGKSAREKGRVTLTPDAGKAYVGYDLAFTADPERKPFLEVVAEECARPWSMTLKIDGQQVPFFTEQGKGVARADLRTVIQDGKRRQVSLTVRATGPLTLSAVNLMADPAKPPAARVEKAAKPATVADRTPIALRLQVPLLKAANCRVKASSTGQTVPAEVSVRQAQGHACADVRIGITGRTVVTLSPE